MDDDRYEYVPRDASPLTSYREVIRRPVGPVAPARSARGRSQAVLALGTLIVLVNLAQAANLMSGLGDINRLIANPALRIDLNPWAQMDDALSSAQGLLAVGGLIALLAWIHRSVANLPDLANELPASTPGWAVAWWFVPIASIYKPYETMSQLYRRSGGDVERSTLLLMAWWGLFLVSNGLAAAFGVAVSRADSLQDFSGLIPMVAGVGVLRAIQWALAIVVVLRIQRWADVRMRERAAERDAAGWGPPVDPAYDPAAPVPWGR